MEAARGLTGLLNQYRIPIESERAAQLVAYLEMLLKWNRRVNLTGSTRWPALSGRFEEAIWASGSYPAAAKLHLDIGSGAGFPAIPLRILNPATRLWMIEPRQKRAAFLETVAAELKLHDSRVIPVEAEDFLRSGNLPEFDVVSWKGLRLSTRAVVRLAESASRSTAFWVFHGASLPVEDPEQARRHFTLTRRQPVPGTAASYFSIYRVSRETGPLPVD